MKVAFLSVHSYVVYKVNHLVFSELSMEKHMKVSCFDGLTIPCEELRVTDATVKESFDPNFTHILLERIILLPVVFKTEVH